MFQCYLCSAVEPSMLLLKDSTNQPKRAKCFSEAISYSNREKAQALNVSEGRGCLYLLSTLGLHARIKFIQDFFVGDGGRI